MSGTTNRDSAFVRRFQLLWSRKWRTELLQIAASSALLLIVGLGLIAAADYAWELNRLARVIALGALAGGVFALAGKMLWDVITRSGRPATAAEIEHAFPELGQSVRTSIQYATLPANALQSEGVADTLVAALVEQTHQRTLPLLLEDVIPTRRLKWIAIGAVIAGGVIFGASIIDWEWGNAAQRAVLAETSYRSLDVQPGDQVVDEGSGIQIDIALIGRTNRDVVLQTRLKDDNDAEWTERSLMASSTGESTLSSTKVSLDDNNAGDDHAKPEPAAESFSLRPRSRFLAKLDRMTRPIEYRVIAGELHSETYHVEIRRPLRIEQLRVEMTPPAYTGQETTTSLDGNLSVLEGTRATFNVTFDKPVKFASLVMTSRGRPDDDDTKPEPFVVDLVSQSEESSSSSSQPTMSASIVLNEDYTYRIEAGANDGTTLPESRYRVRVREDQPPQVNFESPDDSIEVHSLAELQVRLRVRDDYGVSKAGVVFQVNNEQAIPLMDQDFALVASAANELKATGRVLPTTQTALEKVLPLEFFELTQKDSVMYFGFAEDNRPDNPQRTESDMRFIDIRPFKRTYQVVDPDPMPGMGGGDLKSLEELIKRQRFGLNQTMQIEKRAAAGRTPDVRSLDQLMTFETELAASVRQTAEGLLARGFDDVELLYQAESAMLAAVDSLSVGKWENATLQMKDALKALIEQRETARVFLQKNPDPAQLAALRAFDRLQAQKLRRPKTDKEEARELIRRLETLIAEETHVEESLAADSAASDQSKAE